MDFLSEEKLAALAKGTEVELPGFVDRETISVRLRRPSLMLMAAEGKIPNSLLASVEDLFEHGEKNKVSLKERGEIFRMVAMASLVAPSWEDLQNAGVSLTDLQLLTIYNYSQTGVDTLRRFREKQRDYELSRHGKCWNTDLHSTRIGFLIWQPPDEAIPPLFYPAVVLEYTFLEVQPSSRLVILAYIVNFAGYFANFPIYFEWLYYTLSITLFVHSIIRLYRLIMEIFCYAHNIECNFAPHIRNNHNRDTVLLLGRYFVCLDNIANYCMLFIYHEVRPNYLILLQGLSSSPCLLDYYKIVQRNEYYM